jgi:hypothetical protein
MQVLHIYLVYVTRCAKKLLHAGQLYRRPIALHILTAQQRCTSGKWEPDEVALADHLSRVSLTNKVNFARLHGLTLEVIANPVGGPPRSLSWQHCCYIHAWLLDIIELACTEGVRAACTARCPAASMQTHGGAF